MALKRQGASLFPDPTRMIDSSFKIRVIIMVFGEQLIHKPVSCSPPFREPMRMPQPHLSILFQRSVLGLCLGLLPLAASAAGPEAAANSRFQQPSHVVRSGDSIQSISKAISVPARQWEQVAIYNKLPDTRRTPPVGTTIRAPLQLLPHIPATAHVVKTIGEVQVGGQPIHAGVRLGEQASIRTSANSSAVLQLEDGSRVQLMPNSVAQIVENRHYPARDDSGKVVNWFASKLRLAQGALEAAVQKISPRAKPLEVETTTSMIGVRGTRFRVASADQYVHADRAEVLEGAVNNENTWKDTAILLQAGQGVVVDPNQGAMQAHTLLPAPALQPVQEPLTLPNGVWTFPAQPDASAYRVIVSADAQYDTIYRSELLSGPAMDMSALGEGLWYLRVRSMDRHGLEGLDADTQLRVNAAPNLLEKASVYQGNDFRPVLRWSRVLLKKPLSGQQQADISVQVFRDAALRQPVGAAVQGRQDLLLPLLAAGTYYLQITASHAQMPAPEQQTYVLNWAGNTRQIGYHALLDYLPR